MSESGDFRHGSGRAGNGRTQTEADDAAVVRARRSSKDDRPIRNLMVDVVDTPEPSALRYTP